MTEEEYLHDLSNVLVLLNGNAKRLEKQASLEPGEIDIEVFN
jgi:hypothetical protein